MQETKKTTKTPIKPHIIKENPEEELLKDDKAWQAAFRQDTQEAYLKYLEKYKIHAERAKQQLQRFAFPMCLSVFKPLDHLRLLWWMLVMPQQLRIHKALYGDQQEKRIAKWLMSSLIWLPLLIPFLGSGLRTGNIFHLITSAGLGVGWLLTLRLKDDIQHRNLLFSVPIGIGIVLAFSLLLRIEKGLGNWNIYIVLIHASMILGVCSSILLHEILLKGYVWPKKKEARDWVETKQQRDKKLEKNEKFEQDIKTTGLKILVDGWWNGWDTVWKKILTQKIINGIMQSIFFIMMLISFLTKPVDEILSHILFFVRLMMILITFLYVLFIIENNVQKSLETYTPSPIARLLFCYLVIDYLFLIGYCILGNWQYFR
ncbi:MAG: hypothetical protein KAH77_06365 [Thiomargarita sp.]|nr:hypothetical protein [Thiomargarita sp.]